VPGAEAAFQEEIRLFPEDPRAYASLALLYALTGRAPEAADRMRTMTETIPTAQAYAEAVKVYRALHDEQGAQTVLRFARRKFPRSPALAGL
jgi:cytochrome c-type biogenesis protein CcmH/NrfG